MGQLLSQLPDRKQKVSDLAPKESGVGFVPLLTKVKTAQNHSLYIYYPSKVLMVRAWLQ